MKTTKIILALVVGMAFTIDGNAQNDGKTPSLAINTTSYKTAIGLRAGETSGLTIKQFVSSEKAIEGIVGLWSHGLSATILFEKYTPAFNVSGLNWYYGVGGHIALETGKYSYYYKNNRYTHYREGSFGLGIDGIIGLEYKIPSTPFALSLDMKPYIEVVTRGNTWMSLDPGLGIKVTF